MLYIFHKDQLAEQEEEANEQDTLIDSIKLDPENIKSFAFPTYVPPNVKDDMVNNNKMTILN